jgi:hypothetical protein
VCIGNCCWKIGRLEGSYGKAVPNLPIFQPSKRITGFDRQKRSSDAVSLAARAIYSPAVTPKFKRLVSFEFANRVLQRRAIGGDILSPYVQDKNFKENRKSSILS